MRKSRAELTGQFTRPRHWRGLIEAGCLALLVTMHAACAEGKQEHLAGRFDQNTDYRIASISGGRFCSNRIELTAEQVMDRYTLAGDWRDGTLSGAWKRSDDADHGTWVATRPPPRARLVQPSVAVPLYEWRRTGNGTRRYSIEADLGEPGWERASHPLCRVWRPGSIESLHSIRE